MSNDSTHVENPLLRAALSYAERGWPVINVHPDAKNPIGREWQKRATTDASQIRAWWRVTPRANVGVATGDASGLLVVDVDAHKDGEATADALALPPTYTVTTPHGGWHLYYRLPAGLSLGNTVSTKLGPGVDTRCRGGQVLAPPSMIDGKPYVVGLDVPIVELPAHLVDLLSPKLSAPSAVARPTTTPRSDAYAQAALEREAGAVVVAPEGARNDTLNRATFNLGQLVADGSLDEGTVRDKLTAAGLAAGLDEGEVCATVESGLRGGRAQPRAVRPAAPGGRGAAPDEPWTPPTPLSDVPVPPFPTDVLPPVLARYVAELAEATQTPADLPALVVLAVAACACARRIEVEVKEGYREPVNLSTAAVAASGSRKSAVFVDAVRPLKEAERKRREKAKPAIAEAASARRTLEAQLKHAEGRIAKADPEKRASLQAEAAALAGRLDETPIPTLPALLIDDTTTEALAVALAANGERIGMFSDEGGIFDVMAGRYSKSGAPNIDVYLKAHAGTGVRVDRINRPPVDLQHPALTMGLTVQPDVLRGVFAQPSFRGRGLCARFLYAVPQSNIGTRDVDAVPVSPAVRAAYDRAIRRIVDTDSPAKPAIVPLSETARAVFRSWCADHERSLGRDNALEQLADWGSKLPGALVRLAGIFHMLEEADGEVRAESIERAIALAPYLVAHAKAAHAMMGADPEVERARAILRHVVRKQLATFSRRDMFSDLRSRFPRVDAIDAPLALLEAHGYIRADGPPAPAPRGGRPASTRYQVNPCLLAGGHRES